MIVKLNGTLVNTDNICTAKMYYTITKDPINGGKEPYPRIYITFVGGKSETINYQDEELMIKQFENIKLGF